MSIKSRIITSFQPLFNVGRQVDGQQYEFHKYYYNGTHEPIVGEKVNVTLQHVQIWGYPKLTPVFIRPIDD
jgi:hypothetical protein